MRSDGEKKRYTIDSGTVSLRQAFTSLDEALSQCDFDAVDVMLPHDLHEWAAIRCLKAGKHVLLEKPMATTPDGCAAILEAAEVAAKSGTVFMVSENAQYWPEVHF